MNEMPPSVTCGKICQAVSVCPVVIKQQTEECPILAVVVWRGTSLVVQTNSKQECPILGVVVWRGTFLVVQTHSKQECRMAGYISCSADTQQTGVSHSGSCRMAGYISCSADMVLQVPKQQQEKPWSVTGVSASSQKYDPPPRNES